MKPTTDRGMLSAVLSFLVIFSLLLTPAPARAAGITVQENQAAPDFPRNIAFQIRAKADAKIDRVTLIYGVSAESCLESQARHEMVFDAAQSVDLSWEWDLFRSGDLPPGVEVWWQWQLHAADGSELTTEVTRMTVEDPGFDWKQLTSGQITLFWAEGSQAYGQGLLDIAVASLDRLAKTSNLTPSGEIRLTIYPSTDSLKSAMNHTTDWMGGVAFSEYRVVLIAIPTDSPSSWPREVIPHELAHLIFGQRIFNCAGSGAPLWINEGMAMYAEGPVKPEERKAVLAELEKGTLQSLTSIANGFPADSRRANLAYLQSKMLVDFLIETYGKDQLDLLLDNFKEGRGESAFRTVYGLDTASLDQTWRAALGYGTAPTPDYSTPTAAAKPTALPTLALVSPLQQQATATPGAATPGAATPGAATPGAATSGAATAAPASPTALAQPSANVVEPAVTATPAAQPPSGVPPRAGLSLLLIGGVLCGGLAVLLAGAFALVFLLRKQA